MYLRTNVCRVAAAWIFAIFAVTRIAAAQSPLPAPWSHQDIGAPLIAGDATFTDPAFAIAASGADIWGTSDQFHFVYQRITGDVDVRARVDEIVPASTWSKTGVMIRASLDPGAAHGFALVSYSKGLAFQRRPSSSGTSLNTAGEFAAAPRWVRLVRAGTLVTAYSSVDGVSWTAIGSETIQLGATAYVGVATTSHNSWALTTVKVSQVSIAQPSPLPAGQKDIDIGAPALKGSASYNGGAYTITAAGTDIWDTADQFHFVYQQVSGDLDVKVRVASIGYADRWSKAGVMIRQSLDASSAHGFALTSAGKGYGFQRRNVAGGLTTSTSGTTAAPPGWVRLKRNGNLITAYQSTDGVNWTVIGSDSIVLSDPVYVGIAATSHTATATTTVKADNFTVQVTSPPPPTPTPAPTPSPTPSGPVELAFTTTAQDVAASTGFVLEIFTAAADPATATPLARLSLGKPALDATGTATVDITTVFNSLAAGNYQATVSVVWSGGSVRSAPLVFTK